MPEIKALRSVAVAGIHIEAGNVAEVSVTDARLLIAIGAAEPVSAEDGADEPEPEPEPKSKARKSG